MDIVLLINYTISFISLFTVCVFILLFLKHRKDYLTSPIWKGNTPKVSIVIPAYNEGKYIKECLETVLLIDYPGDLLEIIVVDDGSTDDTYKIAKSFESLSKSVRVFTKKNGGKGAAINFGLKLISGDLVATMDADSYLTPGVLKGLVPYFDDPDVMAATPDVKIRASGKWIKELQRIEYMMILFSRKLLSFIDSVPVTPGPFSIFRSSVFEKIGLFDEKNLVEDQEIALRIQAHNFKIKSSLTAEVFTEPPESMADLIKQRVRWQRGGVRNYWHYRSLIKPEYGDFGMYFVPLNFITLTSFFLLLGTLLYSVLTTPYYVNYIWFDIFGMEISFVTFVGTFVILTSTYFLHLAIKSFKGESVKLQYLLSFLIFYWYLMVGYNLLFLFKEIKREPYSW